MPKRNLPSGTKVKRLTLYPKNQNLSEKPEEAAEVPGTPEEQPKGHWQWVPTREKPEMQAPGKLPYFKDLPPKYEEPAPPPPTPKPGVSDAKFFVIGVFIIAIAIIIAIIIGSTDDDWNWGGGGGLNCPTTCNSTVGVTVDQRCACPSPCLRSFKSTNPPGVSGNYKQCYR